MIQDNDFLSEEKKAILDYVRVHKQFSAKPPCYLRNKNTADSVECRKRGNDVYISSKSHDGKVHEQAWKLYTQSIALAPNNSEALALGYGNRSALLFHLEKYEHCVQDCDRAVKITKSKLLKAKLLARKAECLTLLNSTAAKSVCEDALRHFAELELDAEVKDGFISKLQNLMNAMQIDKPEAQSSSENNDPFNLSNFPRQKEAPCASDAVEIRYNEEYGRHIVATRDIHPGEIIAMEKNYFTFIYPAGMYLYCSYCVQPAWASIPCRDCIYDVYCSESCKAKAWTKYHKFDCAIFPYIWDIGMEIAVVPCSLRFLFSTIHDAGGIAGLKKELQDIQECKGTY